MSTIEERLNELRALGEAATGGPWTSGSPYASVTAPVAAANPPTIGGADDVEAYGGLLIAESISAHNAAFIASARTALPATEAALRAARRVIDEAIEDVTAAYTDRSRSEAARRKSDIVRRVLMTLRDDTDRAIAEALGVQP